MILFFFLFFLRLKGCILKYIVETLFQIFPILLEKLGHQEGQPDSSLPWEHVETAFTSMLEAMLQHADTEHVKPMVDIFMVGK